MTYNKDLLKNVNTLPCPFRVSPPNGYKGKVTEVVDVSLSPTLTLHRDLFVPSFNSIDFCSLPGIASQRHYWFQQCFLLTAGHFFMLSVTITALVLPIMVRLHGLYFWVIFLLLVLMRLLIFTLLR